MLSAGNRDSKAPNLATEGAENQENLDMQRPNFLNVVDNFPPALAETNARPDQSRNGQVNVTGFQRSERFQPPVQLQAMA